jgi:hypothetical protein
MRLCFGILLAVVLSVTDSQVARVPAPDPSQGDGGVSSFYTWNDGEVPPAPGQMLRAEPLGPALGLTMASEQVRILYTSTDGMDGKTPVVVSGAYLVPKGAPSASGWPLVAWAHGTWHMAQPELPIRACRRGSHRRSGIPTTSNAWLQQGYAIVATDYQGLGTPGPHPYLAVRLVSSIAPLDKGFAHVPRCLRVRR